MKRKLSILLAFVILFTSTFYNTKAYASTLVNDTLQWETDSLAKINIDGETYFYEVGFENGNKIVTMKDSNNNILDEFISSPKSNTLYIKSIDKEMEVNTFNYNSNLLSSRDYIYERIKISLPQLCTAVGISISVAAFIGVIIAAGAGATTISVPTAKAILKEAVTLSVAIGALMPDHGVNIKFKVYKKTSCRGSDCYTGYYDYKYDSHSFY